MSISTTGVIKTINYETGFIEILRINEDKTLRVHFKLVDISKYNEGDIVNVKMHLSPIMRFFGYHISLAETDPNKIEVVYEEVNV